MISMDVQTIAKIDFSQYDEQVQSIEVSPSYGSGYLTRFVSFQSGISVIIQNFSLHGAGKIRLFPTKQVPPLIGFFTDLSGIDHIPYARPRIPLGAGFSSINLPEYESVLFVDVNANSPVQTFSVFMEPALFTRFTGKSRNELVASLDYLDRGINKQKALMRLKNIDFAQRICGYQAMASFMENPGDTLFLEAKALELVAIQLKQLAYLTGKAPQPQSVDHHAERISYACEILRKEMVNPPRVFSLARRVGLNHNHLIQGFKKMFGLSPFEYLRVIRLEKARDLIASRECNVTEAAFSVGYSSLSHFSKTFREEFGINPKAFVKESKNKKLLS
jgi:AraC-like DNA-binding protein